MEEFKRKVRDQHPHLWPLLEEITTNKTIQFQDELQKEIISETINTTMQRATALREFVAKHGSNAAPKTLAENGDPTARKVMALARKNLQLRDLLQLANQK